MNNELLGQKIRNFRKRKEMSQLDLELELGTSPGSISRIESGEVNPTKETILKIIDILNLSPLEATTLFGIATPNISSLLKIPNELYNSKDLNELLKKAVNSIIFELNLLSSFITLKRGNKLYAITTTDRWFNEIVFKIIDSPFNSLNVDLEKDQNNLCVRAFLDQKIYYSQTLEAITVPAVSQRISKLLAKVTNFKSGIVLPIIHKGESIGTFFVGKTFVDDFKMETPILEEFCSYIGDAISNKLNNG